MKPARTPKLGQSDLLYGPKSPAEKVGKIKISKPAQPHSPRGGYFGKSLDRSSILKKK